MFNLRKIKNFDWPLIIVAIFLFSLGVSVIFSTTSNTSGFSIAFTQIIFGVIGILLFMFFSLFDYRALKSYSPWAYGFIILLLLVVLVVGKITNGASSWIDLGFFRLQPSELAKLLLIISLAKFFSEKGREMKLLRFFFLSLVYVAVPVGLVLLQPDFGTASVIVVIWFGMILATQANKIHTFLLLATGFGAVPVLYQFYLKDYQRNRILTFLNPALDPQGAGYNVIQSTIAVGSGQLFGRGLGHGPQSQLKFLPERYTDFIFSVLAEELGFAGSALLLLLFFILILRIIRIAKIAPDNFGSLIAVGVAVWILFQSFVNIGMNISLMPVTGIPLPLISYGGSSTLALFMGLGILQSIALRHKKLDFKG
ncbi:rod shape-determining protein RodA [bacterium]|nr:rod shape-determining protein RodA [bacterium]